MSDHPALLSFRVLATFYPPSSSRNTAIALSSRARLISIEMWGAPLDMQRTLARGRPLLFLALLLTIASGLALRQYGYALHLPFVIVKYGGSLLWGAMVYWLLATIFVSTRRIKVVSVALITAIFVELFRLWHTPSLDAFRLTTAGALLLGRVFSLWNILAYAAGIALALAIDCALSRREIFHVNARAPRAVTASCRREGHCHEKNRQA